MSEKKKRVKKRQEERSREIRWDHLDNTAHLFPMIAGAGMSNVYRVCAVLKEDIQEDKLQQALDKVLPKFPVFNVRLRQGVFWYYFEENGKQSPKVVQEDSWPCQYVEAAINQNYLFRVSYYKRKISLEVFHVLTDGNGAFVFLKEIIYQYLRDTKPELAGLPDHLAADTSTDYTDGFLQHYRKPSGGKTAYKKERAYHIPGKMFETGKMSLMHGFMAVSQLKEKAKAYGASINEYLVAAFIWSIYQSKGERKIKEPVTVGVPVNLRPHFSSVTTKNFFVMVTAVWQAKQAEADFGEVLEAVKNSLRPQLEKEHLEEVFSYNVSNEKKMILRAVPLWLKKPAMRYVYRSAAKANTTTVSNLGVVHTPPEYDPYIEQFYSCLSRSLGQNMKGCVCSYKDTLVFTISSVYRDTEVQKAFFCFMADEGISVRIESNGVYYE